MPPLRRLVVDVLKPHDPPMLEFADQLADIDSVEGVTASLIELDQEVQNVKLTFEGTDVDYPTIRDAVQGLGASVHSVDQVSVGDYVVEDRETHQDP
ncbi:MAG: DUF211 domain-containing protein [Halobacteriales archaeon]